MKKWHLMVPFTVTWSFIQLKFRAGAPFRHSKIFRLIHKQQKRLLVSRSHDVFANQPFGQEFLLDSRKCVIRVFQASKIYFLFRMDFRRTQFNIKLYIMMIDSVYWFIFLSQSVFPKVFRDEFKPWRTSKSLSNAINGKGWTCQVTYCNKPMIKTRNIHGATEHFVQT